MLQYTIMMFFPVVTLLAIACASPVQRQISTNSITLRDGLPITTDPNSYPLTPFKVPKGSVDTHLHVFNSDVYHYSNTTAYSPPPSTIQQIRNFSAAFSPNGNPIQVVLVNPSPYANNDSALLNGLSVVNQTAHWGSPRGIAVFDPTKVTDAYLQSLHAAGIRGLRVVGFKSCY